MNMVQLQCFLSVSRTLNFTRSASELFFTQSNLSKNIAALEKELGFQLFQRNSHSVQLTEQGACFAREIQEVPDLVSRAAAAAREAGKLQNTVLLVGFMEGYAPDAALLDQLYQFQKDYPQITLRYERYGFRELAEKLIAGELSLALTMSQLGPVDTDIRHMLVERCPVNLVVSKRNPLSQREELSLSDCAGATLVTLEMAEFNGGYSLAFNALERYGCQVGRVVECPNIESQFLELEAGDGISILDAKSTINSSPYVVTYPIPDLEYEVAAYWKTDTDQATGLLIERLKDFFKAE
jgi:DNA-binding transcriptional LysR family regulator